MVETLVGIALGAILTFGFGYLTDAMKWRRHQRTEAVESTAELIAKVSPSEAEHSNFETHVLVVRAQLLLAGVEKKPS